MGGRLVGGDGSEIGVNTPDTQHTTHSTHSTHNTLNTDRTTQHNTTQHNTRTSPKGKGSGRQQRGGVLGLPGLLSIGIEKYVAGQNCHKKQHGRGNAGELGVAEEDAEEEGEGDLRRAEEEKVDEDKQSVGGL